MGKAPRWVEVWGPMFVLLGTFASAFVWGFGLLREDMGLLREDMGLLREDMGRLREDMGQLREDIRRTVKPSKLCVRTCGRTVKPLRNSPATFGAFAGWTSRRTQADEQARGAHHQEVCRAPPYGAGIRYPTLRSLTM